jgi:hypothetical protein
MRLSYDEDFVEGAVAFGARTPQVRAPQLQVRRFNYEREKLYSIPDPDDRNAAFFKLHLEWFREWGLEDRLMLFVGEYPILDKSLHLLAFRKAQNKRDEGAELYVQTGGERTAVIALRVDRFDSDPALGWFLRHELMHLRDMVDPEFGYSTRLQLAGISPTQERLARERYRLLWDVTIDGRLAALHRAAPGAHERRRSEFQRAYSFWPEPRRDETFASLWENPRPTHAELAALASDPRDLGLAHAPRPGSPCPLCGFPTFAWAPSGSLGDLCLGRMRAQFESWSLEEGVCERCAEIYDAISKHELPATVLLD